MILISGYETLTSILHRFGSYLLDVGTERRLSDTS